MNTTITVRHLDPGDKSWLKREARHLGISMEEFVRQLIHEKRERARQGATPSEIFKRYFGPEHGVELSLRDRYGYRPVELEREDSI